MVSCICGLMMLVLSVCPRFRPSSRLLGMLATPAGWQPSGHLRFPLCFACPGGSKPLAMTCLLAQIIQATYKILLRPLPFGISIYRKLTELKYIARCRRFIVTNVFPYLPRHVMQLASIIVSLVLARAFWLSAAWPDSSSCTRRHISSINWQKHLRTCGMNSFLKRTHSSDSSGLMLILQLANNNMFTLCNIDCLTTSFHLKWLRGLHLNLKWRRFTQKIYAYGCPTCSSSTVHAVWFHSLKQAPLLFSLLPRRGDSLRSLPHFHPLPSGSFCQN